MRIQRLKTGDRETARELFLLMSETLGEGRSSISAENIERLVASESFWAVAAIGEGGVVGGLTAHLLPLTRIDQSELLIYDLAVKDSFQRQGIGTMLVHWVRDATAAAGIGSIFVLADNADTHAISFYRKLAACESPVTLFAWNKAQSATTDVGSKKRE